MKPTWTRSHAIGQPRRLVSTLALRSTRLLDIRQPTSTSDTRPPHDGFLSPEAFLLFIVWQSDPVDWGQLIHEVGHGYVSRKGRDSLELVADRHCSDADACELRLPAGGGGPKRNHHRAVPVCVTLERQQWTMSRSRVLREPQLTSWPPRPAPIVSHRKCEDGSKG